VIHTYLKSDENLDSVDVISSGGTSAIHTTDWRRIREFSLHRNYAIIERKILLILEKS